MKWYERPLLLAALGSLLTAVSAMAQNAPPKGTVTINAGKPRVTRSTLVLLKLKATDDGGGAIRMCISNKAKCFKWMPFSPKKPWTIAGGSGIRTVNVWFRDALGNTTPKKKPFKGTILLDMQAPADGVVTATPGDAQLTLNWSDFADPGSGIGSYKAVFQIGNSAPPSCAEGTPVSEYLSPATALVHTGLANGTTYAYRVCAIDAVGNISAGATTTGRPADTTPPTGTVTINGGAAATNSTAATLTLTAADGGGGAIEMCISNTATCSSWTAFAATPNWTLAAGDGIATVNVWYRDQFENTSATPNSDTIVVDTTAPADGSVTATPGDTQLTLEWSGFTDTAGSGIAGYQVFFQEGSAPSSCSGTPVPGYAGTAATLVHSGLTNGTIYGYRVCAIDAVGFISSGATATGQPVPPDTTPPADGTVTVTPGITQQLTLNWSDFTDTDGSGIAGYRVAFQIGSAPSSCTAGTLVPGYDGTGTTFAHTGLINGTTYGYRVCAIDAANNMSTGATATGQSVSITCENCHGIYDADPLKNRQHPGLDGIHDSPTDITPDDAPNVMTYWDGSWWDSNRGGSGTRQQGGHGDPGNKPARHCDDCHDIALPNPTTHLDGVYNSIWGNGSGTRNQNTAHLKANFIGGTTPAWSVQLTLDAACWGCHSAIGGIKYMDHGRDGIPAPGVSMFGMYGTIPNGDELPFPQPNYEFWPGSYPVDQDISTNASGTTFFAPCISCHDPHGTGAPSKDTSSTSTNFMLRDEWQPSSVLCLVCHQ